MSNTTNWLDPSQAKFLVELDDWLRLQSNGDYTGTIQASREMITDIEENGYYNQRQGEVLNELRIQYIENNLKNKL